MPSQVIPQIISLQFSPQNNLEILAQQSHQILDRDELCTILKIVAISMAPPPNI